MARTKPKESTGAAGGGWAHRLGLGAGKAVRLMLPLLILAAIYAVVIVALSWPMRKDAQATLTPDVLRRAILNAKPRPTWIPEGEWRKLADLGLEFDKRSVFDSSVAPALARAYEKSPWIETVGAVRLHYPALVSVGRVAPRVPFARLEGDAMPIVVDRTGCVLPMTAGDLAAPGPRPPGTRSWVDLPSLTGFRCASIPAGQKVTEPEAVEALSLLECVQGILGRAPGRLKAVRVTREPAGTWCVQTAGGPVIEWGYWQDDLRPEGEPCNREKREALTRQLAQWDPRQLRYIRLDQPNAPVAPAP